MTPKKSFTQKNNNKKTANKNLRLIIMWSDDDHDYNDCLKMMMSYDDDDYHDNSEDNARLYEIIISVRMSILV
jgi:hypothetical protein